MWGIYLWFTASCLFQILFFYFRFYIITKMQSVPIFISPLCSKETTLFRHVLIAKTLLCQGVAALSRVELPKRKLKIKIKNLLKIRLANSGCRSSWRGNIKNLKQNKKMTTKKNFLIKKGRVASLRDTLFFITSSES